MRLSSFADFESVARCYPSIIHAEAYTKDPDINYSISLALTLKILYLGPNVIEGRSLDHSVH